MRRIIVRPRRCPLVQQTRARTADEQQVRDLLKAKLETALLMGRLSRG
jgi:hypothetical protein